MIRVCYEDLVGELEFAIENLRYGVNWVVCVRWIDPLGEVVLFNKYDDWEYIQLINMRQLKRVIGPITDEALECVYTVRELAREVATLIMAHPVKIYHPSTGKPIKVKLICGEDEI